MTEMDLPVSWPCYPFLPLKREAENICADFPEVGVLYHPGYTSERPRTLGTTVFLVNVGEVTQKYPSRQAFLRDCPRLEYGSVEELQAAGWVVD